MKPKLYKSLLYSMVGAGMLSLGSCTDLSETIYNQIASEKYEFTEKDAASMFAPVYSSLRNFYWAWYGYADLDICTDMWVLPLRIGVGWGDLYINLHEHTFHSEIGHFSGLWSNAYSGIKAVGGRGRAGIGGVCGPATCLPCVVLLSFVRPFP